MFNFGKNWQAYSLRVLDEDRVAKARDSLKELLDCSTLVGQRFLDVGCGSGLFSIAAAQLGAEVVGIDINPLCIQVSEQNADRFLKDRAITFHEKSALDDLRPLGEFDLVYAWGSLHHTGAMYDAIRQVAQVVAPQGTLVLAIYNTHLTSSIWRLIKWFYNKMPAFVQGAMVVVLGGVIYAAKLLVTRQNPLKKERGMEFWADVRDWVGGYPYEYATPQEIEGCLRQLGFALRKLVPPITPTGCNEFVLVRIGAATLPAKD